MKFTCVLFLTVVLCLVGLSLAQDNRSDSSSSTQTSTTSTSTQASSESSTSTSNSSSSSSDNHDRNSSDATSSTVELITTYPTQSTQATAYFPNVYRKPSEGNSIKILGLASIALSLGAMLCVY
ncbi:hypothetical protein K7432_013006 [Basidiobolus ranarum]|uniref:Uncharacterized protein n=1 Tax=Basidiobolus ranarum TaxID=34480 RepID=A0ABR2WJY2_9FUNG